MSIWASGAAYEPYVGRWSRLVARQFLAWLGVGPGQSWVDVGCGTGALTEAILQLANPGSVTGIDLSSAYVAWARQQIPNREVIFATASGEALPLPTEAFDTVASGLVVNFLPRPERGLAEMARVTKPGGVVAAYVWDYAGEMQLMRYFWNAAVALNPAAAPLDEGNRFPICRPQPLAGLLEEAGLVDVTVRAIDVPTVFKDFDDYWSPFLGGQAPAPAYAMSLDETERGRLRDHIRGQLPIAPDGSIQLVARAWAARGSKP